MSGGEILRVRAQVGTLDTPAPIDTRSAEHRQVVIELEREKERSKNAMGAAELARNNAKKLATRCDGLERQLEVQRKELETEHDRVKQARAELDAERAKWSIERRQLHGQIEAAQDAGAARRGVVAAVEKVVRKARGKVGK